MGSNVSNPGNMFSLGDTKRGSSTRNSLSIVRVTEELDSELSAEQKKRCYCFPRNENLVPREIRRRRSGKDGETDDESGADARQHHYYGSSKDTRSHVGATMQQLTGQRVALMVFVVREWRWIRFASLFQQFNSSIFTFSAGISVERPVQLAAAARENPIHGHVCPPWPNKQYHVCKTSCRYCKGKCNSQPLFLPER